MLVSYLPKLPNLQHMYACLADALLFLSSYFFSILSSFSACIESDSYDTKQGALQ